MNLWVRSQDKGSLVCVKNIFIIELSGKYHFFIDGDYNSNLGSYKTKERALEVLDEIQLMDFSNNKNVKLTSYGYVYEMPKE